MAVNEWERFVPDVGDGSFTRRFTMGLGVTGAAGQYLKLVDNDHHYEARYGGAHYSEWTKTDLEKMAKEVDHDEYAYREPSRKTQEEDFLDHYYSTYQEFN